MFTQGSVSLPPGEMQAVSDQLGNKAKSLGIDIQKQIKVDKIETMTTNKKKDDTIHQQRR